MGSKRWMPYDRSALARGGIGLPAQVATSTEAQPKQALRKALRDLANESGDILPLTNELDGFHRLRVGRYRVIFRYETANGKRRIICVYLAQRKWVYEVFHSRLLGD